MTIKSKMQLSLDRRKLTNWRHKGKRKTKGRKKLTKSENNYNKIKREELKKALELHRFKGLMKAMRAFPALSIETI